MTRATRRRRSPLLLLAVALVALAAVGPAGASAQEVAPGAPAGLRLTTGGAYVDASWTPPSGTVAGYEVEYRTTLRHGNINCNSGRDDWQAVSRSGTGATQRIANLELRESYDVRVRAVNGSARSGWVQGSVIPQTKLTLRLIGPYEQSFRTSGCFRIGSFHAWDEKWVGTRHRIAEGGNGNLNVNSTACTSKADSGCPQSFDIIVELNESAPAGGVTGRLTGLEGQLSASDFSIAAGERGAGVSVTAVDDTIAERAERYRLSAELDGHETAVEPRGEDSCQGLPCRGITVVVYDNDDWPLPVELSSFTANGEAVDLSAGVKDASIRQVRYTARVPRRAAGLTIDMAWAGCPVGCSAWYHAKGDHSNHGALFWGGRSWGSRSGVGTTLRVEADADTNRVELWLKLLAEGGRGAHTTAFTLYYFDIRVYDMQGGQSMGQERAEVGFSHGIYAYSLVDASETVTEGDSAQTKVIINWAAPAEGVVFDVTRDGGTADESDAAAPAQFSVAQWDQEAVLLIDTVDDDVDEDDETYTVRIRPQASKWQRAYDGYDTFTVTIADDDTAGVSVAMIEPLRVPENGTATYGLALQSQPTHAVTLAPEAGAGVTVSPTTVTVTPEAWGQPAVFTLTGVEDDDRDDDAFVVTHSLTTKDERYSELSLPEVAGTVVDTTPESEPSPESEPLAVPGPVAGLSLTATERRVTVRWEPPTEGGAVERYIVHLKPKGGGKGKTRRPKADRTTVSFGKLEPGTTYRLFVRGQNAAGKGERVYGTITTAD